MNLVRRRLVYVCCVVVVFGWAEGALRAQPNPPQAAQFVGKRIVNITFDPRYQPLAPEEINRILPLKRDQPLRLEDVRTAIERLFASGRYEDIQVDA